MATVVVDANVWISALFPAETHYPISRAWVDDWLDGGNGFACPLSFLVEIGCVIGRQPHRTAFAVATVADIIDDASFNLLPIDQALAERAADVGIAAGLRGADALYVAVAQLLDVPLVTWDNELLTRAAPRAAPLADVEPPTR